MSARSAVRRSALVFLALLMLSAGGAARILETGDLGVPEGVVASVAVTDLDAPTMVAFDDQGRMLIAESGYGGAGGPRVTRIEANGTRTALAEGSALEIPVTAVAHHDGRVYVVHATKVSVIESPGEVRHLITDLPGFGDHQANQIVFRDGRMYFTIGTVTNSAVVGYDNWVFGWLRDPALQDRHEVPCEDITLVGKTFTSDDPIHGGQTNTGAYAPFGTTHPAGHVVPGQAKCNGAVLTANLDGSDLRVHAWGLRNPYGLQVGPDNELYLSMHGFDARGSRPIENAWDCFYRVEEGAWYGWPDYACDVPVTDPRFRTPDKPPAEFLLAEHPDETPPVPLAKFSPHAAANGFDFAPARWGGSRYVYLALFGDFAPATGTVPEPQGFKVVRVDTVNGQVTDFIVNQIAGRASRMNGGGFEHPSDVTFGPDGAMYVADWGVADVTGEGLKLEPGSGAVWKFEAPDGLQGTTPEARPPFTTLAWGLLAVVLGAVTLGLVWGPFSHRSLGLGAIAGAVGGVVMGVAAILVGVLVYQLPWFAAPRIVAAMFMGREAQQNILEFEPVSTFVGVLGLVALMTILGVLFAFLLRRLETWRTLVGGVVYGLTLWMLMQHIVWPLAFPLVSDKAFPPVWFAIAFALYGLVLGGVLLYRRLWTLGGARGPERRRTTGD